MFGAKGLYRAKPALILGLKFFSVSSEESPHSVDSEDTQEYVEYVF
jgi:hypothetical protein